ncbi:MAG: alkaline phosphatase family protein [Pseudomonadota bacterium]|nr:alkaline phosphatase family protein [Pseudomonadota bacterium]
MTINLWNATAVGAIAAALCAGAPAKADDDRDDSRIKHVLLISIDGMHAVDFANCAHGVNGGKPYCPTLAKLGAHGYSYTETSTSRPSDSFPGLTALVTGASPATTGAFYDVSYDRSLSPPAKTTPYGIVGGANLCPGTVGAQIGYDEQLDVDYTKLDAGGGIDPSYLPRDPNNGCAPVYPHSFIRTNTIFEVVKAAGGYTAWMDKHLSYELVKGPSGQGVNDFWAPEINSSPVGLNVTRIPSLSCNPLPDQTAVAADKAYTDSFANVQCYDAYKAQGILNEIDGKDHSGAANTHVPTLFGMNFQAVSVGQKLVEKSTGVHGGYLDGAGTPGAALMGQIQFVDNAIGHMVSELAMRGLTESTAIIITAKHGQSAIDPQSVLRIPADDPTKAAPSSLLNTTQALEDDVAMLWLADRSAAGLASAVATLEANRVKIGADGGKILYGPQLALLFNPNIASTPDIVVLPKVGVVYTGGTKKVAEHGGFALDDTNVMLVVSNPRFEAKTYTTQVQTAQVAPTVLKLLGLKPMQLDAVRAEGTELLPGF